MRDAYFSPPELVEALVRVQPFRGVVWEPACGDGAISKVLDDWLFPVVSSDLYHYGYPPTRRLDFLSEGPSWKFDNIITNPPYSTGIIRPWIRRCCEYAPDVLALLMTVKGFADFINPRMMGEMGLRRVVMFRHVPRFRDWERGKSFCPPWPCAWFVAERGYRSTATVHFV